ncbi:membrane protein insertion efficiency factor YidD [Microbacterium bovistercoris]|uniref:Putative membrane protein insertion efficiency factor n=1 Tax=Microbacterium bovistercoris TaxID=2293570 RepID=A0A371NW07_9MICO|nr:membrane protein insertion efficiency factor YidD [Microbacterium bovistercoris]REJ06186.1 membrane protein insertion efficiency factor YidD [Microbacterium bovistercoris]
MSALPQYAYGTATLHPRDLLRSIPAIPRNLVLAFLVTYRKLVSPLYGDVCRYYPSCSAYAVGAVQQHGAVKGSLLSGWRILRCNPWSEGGVDDVRPHAHFRYDLTPHGFVVPARKEMNSGS